MARSTMRNLGIKNSTTSIAMTREYEKLRLSVNSGVNFRFIHNAYNKRIMDGDTKAVEMILGSTDEEPFGLFLYYPVKRNYIEIARILLKSDNVFKPHDTISYYIADIVNGKLDRPEILEMLEEELKCMRLRQQEY